MNTSINSPIPNQDLEFQTGSQTTVGGNYDATDMAAPAASRQNEIASPSTSYSSEAPKEGLEVLENSYDLAAPDGGLRAWLVVAGGFLDYATAFGVMNSFGVFQAYYDRSMPELSTMTITWIGSSQLFVLFFGGIIVGPAFDRYGARPLMSIGSFFVVLSYLITSLADEYYQILLAQGFLFGIGNALLYYPASSSIAEWFEEKRGLALGIAVSGSSAGAIFWPILLNHLLETVGFVWTNRIMCLVSMPLLALSCFLVVERKGAASRSTHDRETGEVQVSAWGNLTERRFLYLSASLCFIYCGMLVPFYYIPTIALETHIGNSWSGNMLSIGYASSVVGRIAAGWVADKYGRFNVLVVIGTLTSTIIFCWIGMFSLAGQVIFAILFGLFSGGLIPLGSACVAQTTPNMEHIGLRIGGMMAICSFGGLIGGPISGVLKDSAGGWAAVFVFSGGMALLGSGLLLAVRLLKGPNWRAIF